MIILKHSIYFMNYLKYSESSTMRNKTNNTYLKHRWIEKENKKYTENV